VKTQSLQNGILSAVVAIHSRNAASKFQLDWSVQDMPCQPHGFV